MFRPKPLLTACAVAALGLAALPARADETAAQGEHLFKERCSICHSPEPNRNKIGPSLFKVVGRPAGSIAGFDYSDANRHSGIVWDMQSLDRYLKAPQAMVPGTRMTFPGLKDDQERAAVIKYLSTLSS